MSNELRTLAPTGDLVATFAALGDERRMDIVGRLHDVEALSITALCEGMAISRQGVSKHLSILAAANIVSARKAGRETLYSLERKQFEEAKEFLNLVGQKWDEALIRLKTHLEE